MGGMDGNSNTTTAKTQGANPTAGADEGAVLGTGANQRPRRTGRKPREPQGSGEEEQESARGGARLSSATC